MNLPYPPVNVTGTGGNKEINLTWEPPFSNGGSNIIEYIVVSVSGDKKIAVVTNTNNATINKLTTGVGSMDGVDLTNGVGYRFIVYSKNRVGISAPSYTSPFIFPISVPDPPTNIISDRVGNKFVSISWTAPKENGGSPITNYEVTVIGTGKTYTSTNTSLTISNLINNISFKVTVSAFNLKGASLPSNSSEFFTPIFTVPDSPTLDTITGLLNSVFISWNPPENNGGSNITRYKINITDIVPLGNLPPQSLTDFTATITNGTTTRAIIPMLSYNYKYSFDIFAESQLGTSLPLNIIEVTTKNVPDPPTNIITVPYNGYIYISWTEPEDKGNTDIISYTVQSIPTAVVNTVTSNSIIIYNLSQTTQYTFSVYATNIIGNSEKLISSPPVYPATTPSSPTNVTVVSGDREVTVSWVPPLNTGGLSISSYTVKCYLSTDLLTVVNSPHSTQTTNSGFTTSLTVRALTNGISYKFVVISTTAVGDSAPSIASPPVIPAKVPDPPINLTVLYLDYRSVNISWDPPIDNGGYEIKSYNVTNSRGLNLTIPAENNQTGNIIGLSPGTLYTFSVNAKSDYGSSVYSTKTITTKTTIPDPPTITSCIPGNGNVTIFWTPPSNTGGTSIAIISYIINATTVTNGTSVIYSQIIIGDSNTKSYVFTNLTNGTPYTFTIFARNTNGFSNPSLSSIRVIPAGLPDPPSDVTGFASDYQTINLSWSAPINNGGYNIEYYTVTVSAIGSPTTTYSARNLTTIITGLLPGTTYVCNVISVNSNLISSTPSQNITITTKTTIPDPPINITGVPGNGKIVLSWTEPTNVGGSRINYYTITSVTNNQTILVSTNSLPTNTFTITGLTNGTSYVFSIVSTNENGDSLPSLPSLSITPTISIPDPPTNINVTPGNNSAIVSWNMPINNGGTPIISYKVTASPGNIIVNINGTSTTTTVDGLINGKSYCFFVIASNAVGNSAPSISIYNIISDVPGTDTTIGILGQTSAVPNPPTNVVSLPANQRALVSWTPPVNTGGIPITSYTVTSNPGNVVGITNGSITAKTLTGLTNGTSYYFSVVASNNYASSEPATSIAKSIGVNGATGIIGIIGVPSSPTNVISLPGNQSGLISWIPPTNSGGVPVSSYIVTSSPGNVVGVTSGTTTRKQLAGLTNGTSYYFSVMASNTYANSLPATSIIGSAGITGTADNIGIIGVPSSPINVTSLADNQSGIISWTPATNTGGVPIYSYTVKSSPGNVVGVTDGMTTTKHLTGLTNGTSYYFSVMASNTYANSLPTTSIIGSSGITATANNIGIIGVPGQPTNIIAVPGNQYGFVSWTPPINTGGAPISSYKVTSSPGNVIGITDGVTTDAIITGLNNGTPYSFSVSASNGYVGSLPGTSTTIITGIATSS